MPRSFAPASDDYSPFEDDYRGFDLRDSDEGQRGPLILLLAVGVLLIFGAIVWNAYRTGYRTSPGGIPVVSAPMQDYKYAYVEPGTENAPTTSPETLAIEQTFAEIDRLPIETNVTEAEFLAGGPPVSIRRGLDEKTEADEEKTAVETAEAPTQTPVTIDRSGQPVARGQAGSATRPVGDLLQEPSLIPDITPLAPTSWQIATNGQFLVQVGAFRSEAAASKAWSTLSSRQPELLQPVGYDIQRADLGAKGVFYRLRANAFPTRKDAVEFCDALKSNGESCIVVTR